MSTPYRYLIHGTLVQKTPLNSGGNQQDANDKTDQPLAKDGAGRYTLRGSSLAGAMIATARQLYGGLPEAITHGSPKNQNKDEKNRLEESRWIFHHSHPLGQGAHSTNIRDNVAIRHTTGAARHGAKFDIETLPAGTRWPFLMEVDTWREADQEGTPTTAEQLIGMALNTVKIWQKGACWLGGRVAQGQGWMYLEDNIQVYRLEAEHALVWPNAEQPPFDDNGQLLLEGVEALGEEELQEIRSHKPPGHSPYYFGSITLTTAPTVTEEAMLWGIDCLSSTQGKDKESQEKKKLKASQGFHDADDSPGHWIAPMGQPFDKYLRYGERKGEMDGLIMVDHNNRPIIQGSGLRGSLRHALSWLLRKQGVNIQEPGMPASTDYVAEKDLAQILFGSTKKSGLLLISDARIENDDWKIICQEMHAEDEFTQGVYADAKFDRPQLINARFAADYCLIRTPKMERDEEAWGKLKVALEYLDKLGQQRLINIGGGAWKGMGWVRLEITTPRNTEVEQEPTHAG